MTFDGISGGGFSIYLDFKLGGMGGIHGHGIERGVGAAAKEIKRRSSLGFQQAS